MADDGRRWSKLVGAWKAEEGVRPPEHRVRARVRRQTVSMWLIAAFEALLTLALLVWSARLVRAGVDAFDAALLVTLWAFWAIAAGYAYLNRRGSWRATGESTRGYVEISLERARRRLRTTRFVVWLLAAEVIASLVLIAWRQSLTPLETESVLGFLGFLAVVSVAYLGWSIRTRRRTRREIEILRDLLEDLERSEAAATDDGL